MNNEIRRLKHFEWWNNTYLSFSENYSYCSKVFKKQIHFS